MAVEYDEIGIWSEVKLAIIKEYASAYATILDAKRRDSIHSLKWLYIDAFAGPGVHLSKRTGTIVDGSPLIALKTVPAFAEYHFIDADQARAAQLRGIAGLRSDVHIYSEDCNDVLLRCNGSHCSPPFGDESTNGLFKLRQSYDSQIPGSPTRNLISL